MIAPPEVYSPMADVPEAEIEAMQTRYPLIPRPTIESVLRYARFGTPPGHFVQAVLRNDLFDALGRADKGNRAAIGDICSLVYNWIPNMSWGSPERVQRWIARKGLDE